MPDTAVRTTVRTRRRPGPAARRVGYVIAVVVNLAMLYAVHVWPGWSALSFLTADTRLVLGLLDASMVVGVVINVIYVGYDGPAVKAPGDILTSALALAVFVRIWQVFPFDFAAVTTFDAALLVRFVVVIAAIGAAIGLIVQLAALARWLLAGGPFAQP